MELEKPSGIESKIVYETKEYYLFKSIKGNRVINKSHLARLKQSMMENYIFTILVVNEKYEIIDGQHRFEAIKELELPMYYVVCEGYGLNEVYTLNLNSKTWNSNDFLMGYCNLGNENYIRYRKFLQTYGIGHKECLGLLKGLMKPVSPKYDPDFSQGTLVITDEDYDKAKKIMDQIYRAKEFYKDCHRRSYIQAMFALFKYTEYDHEQYLKKLALQPKKLVNCSKKSKYLGIIEEIYNFNRKNTEKLSFKYLV